jgi:putative ABC transport system permease protein
MTGRSILASSAKRRLGDAILLFASTAASVMAISIFTAAAASPSVLEASGMRRSLAMLFSSAAIVTALFAALSGWFFAEHYLSRRRREVATWLLLGMRKRVAFCLLSAEFAVASLSSLLAGLGAGLLLSRFFALALAALMKERTPIAFPFGWASATAGGLACLFQFVLASLRSAITVSRISIADLMRAEREAERPPRSRPFLAGLGALLVLGSYCAAILAQGTTAIFLMIPVLLCTIAGTFLCFSVLVPTIAAAFRRRRKGLDAAALVAAAQLAFRSRRNARLLALTAVLVAVAATACGTVIALNTSDAAVARRVCPHDIELPDATGKGIDDVNRILLEAGARPGGFAELGFLKGEIAFASGQVFSASFFPASAWTAALSSLGEKAAAPEAGRFRTAFTLNGVAADEAGGPATLRAGGASLSLLPSPEACLPPLSLMTANNAVIVPDGDYKALAAAAGREAASRAAVWDGIEPGVLRPVLERLSAVGPRAPRIRVSILAEQDGINGAMLFVGIFLAAVFILCAVSLLVFRVTEDSRDDADRYRILQEIGASRRVIRSSLALQDLFSFGLPLAIGLAHCAVALVMMRNISGFQSALPTLIVAGASVPLFVAAALLAVDRQLSHSCPAVEQA